MTTKILSTGAGSPNSHPENQDTHADTADAESRASSLQLPRAILIAVFAAAIVTLILLAFSWPTVTSDPKDLPIAAVGDEQQIDQITDNAPEGMLDVREVDSREEAVKLIEEREVYGAFILGDEPEILTAKAASPAVAQQLSGIGDQMQHAIDAQAISGLQKGNEKMAEEMQKALTAAASGQSPAQGNPAGQSGGPAASAMDVPQVEVTDVVPLSDDDPSGAGLAIAGLPLTIGGIVGGVLTSMAIRSRRMRGLATIVYGTVGGLALALIMQSWFGILQGSFGLNALAIGLAIAATAGLINGFVSLIGPAGIAVGAVLTMFIGNPIASLNQPKEFLAGSWGEIGQFFVPGAAGTLLRDLSYFPDAAVGLQWWVLVAWFSVGIALILVGHLIAHRKQHAATH
ncbi:ABC transporter permease [Brevibacterium spongiae]|uniref:ABC transporter permease n=1 Tax=Brevibacterium spongiae TaxID=2909672 RepID=A0ABY5SXE0_9MICO|nr:ABC transporter permease [Brevibacterium spongiae]UVI37369.1 ABC transporter permease [Brevibacterium spongiae]